MKIANWTIAAAAALSATGALAGPIALPAGPYSLQYYNAEQFSATNDINNMSGGKEGNWGIMQVSNIVKGTALPPTGSDIQGGGTPFFVDQLFPIGGAQILGMFYDIRHDAVGTTGTRSHGGKIDLYWWQGVAAQNVGTELSSGANLAKRTAQNEYTGFTCASGNTANCTFLGELTFEPGVEPGYPAATVFTPTDPQSLDGTSKSYLSVDTSKLGAWTTTLDGNYFTLDPCNNPVGKSYSPGDICPVTGLPVGGPGGVSMTAAQDVRLDNNFTRSGATAWDIAGTDTIGLRSNDPARGLAVPEPGSLALAGLALVGLAAIRRTRKV